MGFEFFNAKKINVLMVKGAALNVECKLVKKFEVGDHIAFIGEAVEVYPVTEREPLVYHGQKFWKFGENIPWPEEAEMNKFKAIVEKHTKK